MKKLSFLFFLLVACITAFAGNVISGKKAAPLRAAAKMPTFCSETTPIRSITSLRSTVRERA